MSPFLCDTIQSNCCYFCFTSFYKNVCQDDLFVNTLTTEEHLTFVSKFIFKRSKSKIEISAIVQQLLTKLRLQKCRNTVIGSAGFAEMIPNKKQTKLFRNVIFSQPHKASYSSMLKTDVITNQFLQMLKTSFLKICFSGSPIRLPICWPTLVPKCGNRYIVWLFFFFPKSLMWDEWLPLHCFIFYNHNQCDQIKIAKCL